MLGCGRGAAIGDSSAASQISARDAGRQSVVGTASCRHAGVLQSQ
ncbi:MAG: hypothetical protein ACLVLZ_06075 [[Clostridium] scindens]